MIYPSVTQLNPKARKDYNYWGIFSTVLILLCWNLGLMVGCIVFEVKVAEYNREESKYNNKLLRDKGVGALGDNLNFIEMIDGFGGATLALFILHL